MSSSWLWTSLDQLLLRDVPVHMRLSYLCFAGALFFCLGSQQFIAPVKITVFMTVVGAKTEPLARSLLLAVMVPILVAYGAAYSRLRSASRLAFWVCGLYAAVYVVVAVAMVRSPGLPPVWAAWLLYYASDTKSVIVLPMLWSMLNEMCASDVAKKVYPELFFVAQVGGIAGAFVAAKASSFGGEVGLLALQVVALLAVPALVGLACRFMEAPGAEDRRGWTSYASIEAPPATAAAAEGRGPPSSHSTESSGGAGGELRLPTDSGAASVLALLREGFDGLWLLFTRPYVLGAFFVSYAGMVPRTVLEYENSIAGMAGHHSEDERIAFFGRVNMYTNIGTALLSLLGVRPVVERIGVGACLLVLPVGSLLCIAALCVNRSPSTTTVAVVAASVLAYGLNSPCKEMLYVRTSKDIKYKAKSWSSMYGHQLMKVIGAQMNMWVNRESPECHPYCFHGHETLSLVLIWTALWAMVAHRTGAEYRRLEKEDMIVG